MILSGKKELSKLLESLQALLDGELDTPIEIQSEDAQIKALGDGLEQLRVHLQDATKKRIASDSTNIDLIRNISHDLKTPITAIKGYAGGIIDGVANTPDKLEKYANTIYNKACDMDALIDELTLYSKIDTSRIPYEFEELDVEDFFGGYAKEMQIDLEQQGLELSYYNYLTEDTHFIGDREQLRRVLGNIISNSVKYTDAPGGFIKIRVRDEDAEFQVEIEDAGKGIAKKDLPYIFDRFYRTDESRNSSTGGSGIGLSIVRKIIEDHGGRIWATSEVGVGTVMHFVLRKYKEEKS